jgi:hypothetical protein
MFDCDRRRASLAAAAAQQRQCLLKLLVEEYACVTMCKFRV